MISSAVMLAFFALGLLAAWTGTLPEAAACGKGATYVLYAMLLLVGVGVGAKERAIWLLHHNGWRIVLLPAVVVVGSLAGAGGAGLLVGMPVAHGMAVGAGFGYYSLSSVLIDRMADDIPSIGRSLAVVALLSNVFRELLTLVASPLLARWAGGYAPIVAGGATSMDSTLAVVTKFSGPRYAMVAMFNGVVLSFLVPVLVPLILRLGG